MPGFCGNIPSIIPLCTLYVCLSNKASVNVESQPLPNPNDLDSPYISLIIHPRSTVVKNWWFLQVFSSNHKEQRNIFENFRHICSHGKTVFQVYNQLASQSPLIYSKLRCMSFLASQKHPVCKGIETSQLCKLKAFEVLCKVGS